MGLSSLTRYNLFMESGDSIESDDGIVRFRDYLSVKNMYYDSARLIRGFEDIINNEERMPQMEEYQGIFDRNANEVQDLLFVQRITNQIQQQMSKANLFVIRILRQGVNSSFVLLFLASIWLFIC